MYLDGDKSIRRLRSFLVGYDGGLGACGLGLEGRAEMAQFEQWIAVKLETINSTSGWCNMVLSKVNSDEKAYELFFQLLDEYRTERTTQYGEPS